MDGQSLVVEQTELHCGTGVAVTVGVAVGVLVGVAVGVAVGVDVASVKLKLQAFTTSCAFGLLDGAFGATGSVLVW